MIDRFNTPQSDGIEVEVLGHNLLIKQDPNSKHLGTTVWDSSLVFVKFLERNSKKGEFCRAKLAGKRVIELGAGCGLAGLGMALLGCDVVVTDQVEVIPLLLRNVERNLSRAKHTASDNAYMGSIGKVEVAELDWGNETHIAAVGPPFDYIIGTDVVYKEQYVEPLINTILALAGPKTTVLLGYEFRSSGVRELLGALCQKHFSVKRVLHSKMDPKYQHPDIDLYIMRVLEKSGPAEDATPYEYERVACHSLSIVDPASRLDGAIRRDGLRRGNQEEHKGISDTVLGIYSPIMVQLPSPHKLSSVSSILQRMYFELIPHRYSCSRTNYKSESFQLDGFETISLFTTAAPKRVSMSGRVVWRKKPRSAVNVMSLLLRDLLSPFILRWPSSAVLRMWSSHILFSENFTPIYL